MTYRIAKFRGDDAHSWAVFRNGRPVVTGLSRKMAEYHKSKLESTGDRQ